jgi:hypothetical protein
MTDPSARPLEEGLRVLEAAARDARSIRVEVDDLYAQWIAEIEARPDNQSGADKTAVWHSQQVYLAFFEHARRRSSTP